MVQAENNEDEDGDYDLHQCARCQAKPPLGIIEFIIYNHLRIDITPFLQIRKLRLAKVKELVQGHEAEIQTRWVCFSDPCSSQY